MKIYDYIDEKNIIFIDKNYNKDELLKFFAKKFKELYSELDEEEIYKALYEREILSSTAVGEEVAIPHAKINNLDDLKILIALSDNGLDFDAVDDLPVRLFFVVIAPSSKMQLHLKALARISRLIKMTDFKEKVLKCNNPSDALEVLKEEEDKL
ncbi:PTS sugar transporter subunit IIA [Deferribacter thermophilus]|uniref:PTS sugar transporter subunit IIA n=1 Tax=Deferribacter thermophilus TaxID=53573 RepID=UPI003C247E23